ncbi:Ni/Fe hydrogenase subunit alpha [Anaeromyxobacter terrae]|uniref:Ni/Fe hydrogenase subunit alpha n=1 Tax=Anaeromyxobacter terrae TaxID=2925406 RepID=UPI001F587C46|nr:Ni/Fe hydrogenase subunit alpha [Anaeromyxobacter sp. SG22]
MARRVLVDVVSRIEGRARITLRVDREGRAIDARVEGLELRGFESICVGRPIGEMPALTARICGICPVSHSLAAARAGDAIAGAEPPPPALALRRLVSLGSLVQSHATSFFFLAAPDLALDPDAPDDARNPFALARSAPALLADGVLLRGFGGQLVEKVAGRRVHPAFAVPGGVTHALDPRVRDDLSGSLESAMAAAERTVSWWLDLGVPRAPPGREWLLAHVGPGGELLGDRMLRVVAPSGALVEDAIGAGEALGRIVERAVPFNRAKLCAWRDTNGSTHAYAVGPVARLTASARCRTPRAARALATIGGPGSAMDPHAARLVEMLAALEEVGELLQDPLIASPDVLTPAGVWRREGVGACEAPRGALFHEYRVDRDGLVTAARIVAPTGQNARAMNAAVREIAREAGSGREITPTLRRRVQAAVRRFDPCMSCATHSAGREPAALRLVGPRGEVLDEWPRQTDECRDGDVTRNAP